MPVIGKGNLQRNALRGKVAIITGAGRGIGAETAVSLAYLGARVVIAEIDDKSGEDVAQRIEEQYGPGAALAIKTDVGDEVSVKALAERVQATYGRADFVINNATTFKMGSVKDVPIADWDRAYRVNVRGPVLMAQSFLPGMIQQDYGVFICVSSSGAAPYMGAYEVFKTAQVELARTIDAEMEGKNVQVLTIGPGLVHTPGSEEGIRQLAPLYGKTVDEFYALSKEQIVTPEEAGAGFAAAVALAPRFRGQEISSYAALSAAGIELRNDKGTEKITELDDSDWSRAAELCRLAISTLSSQYDGWKKMVIFKRQWILRDFKNSSGMPVEQWLDVLRSLLAALDAKDASRLASIDPPLLKLESSYAHMQELLRDYEKDQATLEHGIREMDSWRDTLITLDGIVHKLE